MTLAILARVWLFLLSRPALSRGFGWAADLRLPGFLLRPAIAAYVRLYRVDLAESAEPVRSFRTFDAFFTRRLKADARPLDPRPDVITSPCDARIYGCGRIPDDGRLEQIKGKSYGLDELLGDPAEAGAFKGGSQATLYLSPAMYHRVHWPADATLVAWRRIPGPLYPVNALAVRHVDRLFAVNRRAVLRVETDRFGPLALVMVGATNVGRIELAFEGEGAGESEGGSSRLLRAKRGDELGAFHLGSTVVLLAADPHLTWIGPPAGELVRMGEALWRRG